ncbi:MAG: hypothetical protein VCD66_19875 [Alphaproteobacteria bacterium]|jgi:predicted TIM-barrel fold metal-dependent hydrolase
MSFPIIDCHQHFCRLGQGNYPWLEQTDPPPDEKGTLPYYFLPPIMFECLIT